MKKSRIFGVIAAAAMAVSAFVSMPVSAADSYNAYIGIQTNPGWYFRNAWNEASFGQGQKSDDGYVYFENVSKDGAAADVGGTFTDAQITGDGTYKVSLTDIDLSAEEKFSQLFISTDIPLDAGVTISDVKVIIDGQTKYTFDEAYISPDEPTYMFPYAINIWNDDLGKEDGMFAYVMPSSSVEMEFTISGMGAAGAAPADNAAAAPADDAADTSAPAADTAPTTSASTGNLPVAAMASVAAVAGVVAVVSRKRK